MREPAKPENRVRSVNRRNAREMKKRRLNGPSRKSLALLRRRLTLIFMLPFRRLAVARLD